MREETRFGPLYQYYVSKLVSLLLCTQWLEDEFFEIFEGVEGVCREEEWQFQHARKIEQR